MDIEPFSGSALRAVVRYQVSTVVSSKLVSSPIHPKPLNVSYIEDNTPHYRNVIPVFWTEITQEISEQQAKQLDENVCNSYVMTSLNVSEKSTNWRKP